MFFYSGLPGAGKSYGAVEHLLMPAAKEGRPICTNIVLTDAFREAFPVQVLGVPSEVGDQVEFWREIPPGALVVLDEAWRFFPAGISANKLPESVREALAMHRHRVDEQGRSQQWVLISQNPSQTSKFVRDLVEQHFRITKLSAVGARSKFRVDVYEGVELDESKRVRQIFGSYRPEIWAFYRSHTASVSGTGEGVDESSVDKRGTVWRSGWVWFGFPVVGVLLLWGASTLVGFFPGTNERAGAQAARAAVAAGPRPSGEVAPAREKVQLSAAVTGKPLSTVWRIAAELRSEESTKSWVVLVNDRDQLRRVSAGACIREDGQTICEVDGEKVAPFTGVKSSLGQAIVGGIGK